MLSRLVDCLKWPLVRGVSLVCFRLRCSQGWVFLAASLFRKLCYENKNALMAGIICAGWDPVHGGQVFSIPLGGSLVKQPFAIGGSGSTYIYGWVDANYREGMTKEQCVEFVRNGLSLGTVLAFLLFFSFCFLPFILHSISHESRWQLRGCDPHGSAR